MSDPSAPSAGGLARRGPLLAATAGILGLVRAGVGFADPRYYDPTSALDYTAVILTTLTMVAAGLAILAARPRLGRIARVAAFVPAYGLIVTGISNLIEDGIGVEALGVLWGIGSLTILIGGVVTGVAAIAESDGNRLIGAAILAFGLATLLPEVREIAQGIALLFLAWTLTRSQPA